MNKKCANRKKGSFRKNQDFDKKSKSSKDVESNVDSNKGFNDFSWYNKNPILLESAARIPFAVPTGGDVDAGTLYWNAGGGSIRFQKSWKTSGVMALDVTPAIGYSDSPDSPATIAAREIYAKVRKAYSGTLAVDAPDFMMYLLALDGIFSYIARLKRIYRTINVYSGVNKYTPEVLLGMNLGITSSSIVGYDAVMNSLRNNKTKLWGGINTLIHNVSKFTCPAIMDIFNRHYWMNDNYFMDRPTRKAQIYMFRQSEFWKFGLDSESRGSVSVVSFGGDDAFVNVDAVDYLLKFGNDLLAALNDDEDAYTINGYLQRAFEGYSMFKIDDLKEDEVAEFVYSPEVLLQIHNAKVIPASTMKISVTQTGINSNVISTPQFDIDASKSAMGGAMPNTILDVDSELPDMPTVVVASRLMYAYDVQTPNPGNYKVKVYCGTEVVNSFVMATMEVERGWSTTTYSNNVLTATDLTSNDLRRIARWSMFNMAPVLTTWFIDSSKGTYAPLVMGDLTNPTSVDNDALKNLNRMCIYSEFNSFSI